MAKAPVEIIVEGRNIADMNWAALEKLVVDMTHELLLERGERTKTRKECDIMRTCWQNSEEDLEEAKAKLLKKYLEGESICDKNKEPLIEKEQEITYHKFILDYNMKFQEREDQRMMERVNKRWDDEVLPEMMEAKTREAERFDRKQEELSKEYEEAQVEYKNMIDEAVKVLDDKLLDRRRDNYRRLVKKKQYEDLQIDIMQVIISEQKNLLIHDLQASHKVNFDKITSFIRERVEGDIMHIMSLITEINKLNEQFKKANGDIEIYKKNIIIKKNELEKQEKTLKLYQKRLKTYKKNIDRASMCERKAERLTKDKSAYDQRKQELEDQITTKRGEIEMYMDAMKSIHANASKLQTKLLEDQFQNAIKEHKKNIEEFDKLMSEHQEKDPESVKWAEEEFVKQKSLFQDLPFWITREIKGHNEFIESAMVKLCEVGLPRVPAFVRVTDDLFPTGSGPAALAKV